MHTVLIRTSACQLSPVVFFFCQLRVLAYTLHTLVENISRTYLTWPTFDGYLANVKPTLLSYGQLIQIKLIKQAINRFLNCPEFEIKVNKLLIQISIGIYLKKNLAHDTASTNSMQSVQWQIKWVGFCLINPRSFNSLRTGKC